MTNEHLLSPLSRNILNFVHFSLNFALSWSDLVVTRWLPAFVYYDSDGYVYV